jgi:exopolyphosphatase / guanosine-5'-triphosphate,3'-diphosphate pyrophosphatase
MEKRPDLAPSLPSTTRQSLVDWAELLRVDVEHQVQVARLALQIFDGTRELHGLDEPARALLEAAALLHDVGFSVDEKAHHKHSHDLILEHGVPGLGKTETRAIACIARYHRKAEPSADHKAFGKLSEALQETVRRLSAILRVADGLDRSHQDRVRRVTCEVTPSEVRMRIEATGPTGGELYGVTKKKEFFETLFRRSLSVEVGSASL